MDDERSAAPQSASTTTPAVTASAAAQTTGGNQNPLGPKTNATEIGVRNDPGSQTAGQDTDATSSEVEENRSFGARAETNSENGERAVSAADKTYYGPGHSTRPEAYAGEHEYNPEELAPESQAQMTLDDIEGHVLRAIRYHEARARFLDFWRRVFDFLVVVLGAGAVTTATTDYKVLGTVIGIALAAIGALQLVAGFSEKAGEHTSLKRRFCDVLARITEARASGADADRSLEKITKRWAAIWADEPPTMHVLEAIAWNAARRTREHDLDEDTLIAIGWWPSLTRNLSSWESFEPLTRGELAQRKAAAR